MSTVLIRNAKIVNEGAIFEGDILIENEFIKEIAEKISPKSSDCVIIDAEGSYVIPGAIDDQVHFREPGLTHKGNIETESRAAVAGGITSFIEQPNTVPNAVTQELLEDKYQIASQKSYANYSFMMGGTNDNLDEVLKTNPRNVAGIKLFLGSSTGNMLVDNPEVLEKIFSSTKMLIAVHCEDEATIKANTEKYREEFGDDIPMKYHHLIRSAEACYLSSSKAIELAKKTGARLHVFHLSTAKEMELFTNKIPLEQKQITAEVCVHHLWFTDADYETKGSLIKWNPAVKTQEDKDALWKALLDDRIDVIATDHAPHAIEEKEREFTKAPSGIVGLETSLSLGITSLVKRGYLTMMQLLEKMTVNPARLYKFDCGTLEEGKAADIVIFAPDEVRTVESFESKAENSPFLGAQLYGKVKYTICDGKVVYRG